jgi:acyl-CoA reductase-like NAD-dependent aldehyde dehydrogenase
LAEVGYVVTAITGRLAAAKLTGLEGRMLEHGAHYIGGRWQPSSGGDRIAVVNAATEELLGSIPAGNAEDADKAVRAARHAPFGGYRQSGNGREFGEWGLEEFLETKSMQLP